MEQLWREFNDELAEADTPQEVEAVRVRFLGRKGEISTLMKTADLSRMSPEERRAFGQRFNEMKGEAEEMLARKAAETAHAASSAPRVDSSALDMTLPGSERHMGSLHPITLVQLEVEEIFRNLGFTVLTGYEVETEYFNFDALNIPADHPARDMQDTYWLTNGQVLRTHTSACQGRALKEFGAPLRAIFPGRCFRYESIDAKHDNTFYQLEGLLIDHEITVAHLIGMMKLLLSRIFHREVTVRLRPGYFPFVEPGFELDLQCLLCEGAGCFTCRTGWLELIPCGLVHPCVLKHGGINPDEFSGFAFGLGLTRLAMMTYGIPDIRVFNAGDIRFYEQFPATV